MCRLFESGGQSIGVSASASVKLILFWMWYILYIHIIYRYISSEYSRMISFRIDWFDLLAVQGTLKSLLQHHSLKESILQRSVIFYGPTLISVHDYWKNHSFDYNFKSVFRKLGLLMLQKTCVFLHNRSKTHVTSICKKAFKEHMYLSNSGSQPNVDPKIHWVNRNEHFIYFLI